MDPRNKVRWCVHLRAPKTNETSDGGREWQSAALKRNCLSQEFPKSFPWPVLIPGLPRTILNTPLEDLRLASPPVNFHRMFHNNMFHNNLVRGASSFEHRRVWQSGVRPSTHLGCTAPYYACRFPYLSQKSKTSGRSGLVLFCFERNVPISREGVQVKQLGDPFCVQNFRVGLSW